LAALSIHGIPDGSLHTYPSDPGNVRIWLEDDGINIFDTPLSSPDFNESCHFGKGIKHRKLRSFIQDVAAAGFPSEEVATLTSAAGLRLTHLFKSAEKNPKTELWMNKMNSAHVST